MISKFYTVMFFGSLIGSTLCVVPHGEIQIGPLFGKGGKFFGGNKHFEAFFHKGADLKPLLAKKVLIGVGALGAGALAAGGAALIAKKIHPHLAAHAHSHGWGWGGKGYAAQGHYDYNQGSSLGSGWGSNNYNGGYDYGHAQTHSSATADVKFPSSYPTQSSYYPSTEYGYPQSEWQGSDSYSGWSR